MKKIVLFSLLIALVLSFHFSLRETNFSFSSLRQTILSYGALGPIAFVSSYILSSIILFPATFFTLLAGALYGPWIGLAFVTIGANLGASLAFFLGRFFGFEFAKKILETHFPNVEQQIQKNGFLWIFSLRLLPVTPFVFFNYAAGLTPVSWRDYALGSFLGMLPMTFVYVTLGATVGEFSEKGSINWRAPESLAPFVLAVVVAFFVRLRTKRY